MANDDTLTARGGLLPVGYPYGNFRRTYYRMETGSGVKYYIGQPVDLASNGEIEGAVTAADNKNIVGSIVGFLDKDKKGLTPTQTSLSEGAAFDSTTYGGYAAVADDPDQLFMIQADTSASLSSIDVAAHCRWTYARGTSGNTTTGYSAAELETSDVAADTAGTLQIVAIADNINSDGTPNTPGVNYCKAIVRIAHHRYASQVDGGV